MAKDCFFDGSIACEVTRRHTDGRADFTVLNGAWRGTLSADESRITVYFPGGSASYQFKIIWQADEWPKHTDYNDLIITLKEETTHDVPPTSA